MGLTYGMYNTSHYPEDDYCADCETLSYAVGQFQSNLV
eukprot:CAMPEP_0116883504 /NCGR_PEP_ID=MMETSP0463-20121206/16019_1 /TAXON_ID=181622 /ORGANISM="Strombidinopsis sp, Strain SopsisLIS2011" /LENGTH=37 /DNA_ID= /DNA_START= /DNA_END= /DNA_ORIENTATION=